MTDIGLLGCSFVKRALLILAMLTASLAAPVYAQQPLDNLFGARVERDIAYGPMSEQRMDVYLPKNARKSPIILMVHGGAWTVGSKSARGVVENKVAHWLPKGFIFVSVETRLMPAADPLQQAADVAAAMAVAQRRAGSWGGDPSKIVLMGHSAGAHLVALVSTDRSIAEKAGVKQWAGTVALDSAAYDVSAIMERPGHPRFYDRVFGSDPRFWSKASPALQLNGNVPPMLLVCSSLRRDSCPQADAFAGRAGGRAEVLKVALRHGAINSTLGLAGTYTHRVDAFLDSLGVR
ncbi:alpha/beta hydrolase [Aliirhizobium smilacinae]|uniref:Alpha/beta hydrolase n=1 Tax=Aliirhizobium smilacinae TaxID=1395944 RepID=A0A5C4XFF5_9HYPH|nr:alpha/beta hydrolase [Rhizobium smilacinae]TNM62233.1 alpha/beta hydrolase [Rhizobium smilacinae]